MFRASAAFILLAPICGAHPLNPPPGLTCASCHSGTRTHEANAVLEFNEIAPNNFPVLSTTVLSYKPGVRHVFVLRFVWQTPPQATGFQMKARLASNDAVQAGIFLAGAGTSTQTTAEGHQYINNSAVSGSNGFTIDWTPPATDVGPIRLSLTTVTGALNGSPDGNVIQASYTLTPARRGPPAAFQITQFDAPGATTTKANAIASDGTIAGEFQSGGLTHGFVRLPNGSITTFDAAAFGDTRPYGVNANRQVVGVFQQGSGIRRGFLRSADGAITLFDVPGASLTELRGITNGGLMIGSFLDSTGRRRGFTSTGLPGFQTLDVGYLTSLLAVNNRGYIIGAYVGELNGVAAGFLRDDLGSMSTGPSAGCAATFFFTSFEDSGGLNDQLDMALKCAGRQASLHAEAGPALTFPTAAGFVFGGINDARQVAGSRGGRGLLMTPCEARPLVESIDVAQTGGLVQGQHTPVEVLIPMDVPAGCEYFASGDGSRVIFEAGLTSANPFRVSVPPNLTGANVTEIIRLGGREVRLRQAGGSCQLSLTGPSEFPGRGGTGSITVSTGAGCPWEAHSDPTVVTVGNQTPAIGTGPGSFSFNVRENFRSAPRTGRISVGFGQSQVDFAIAQQGQPCSLFIVTPREFIVPASGGEVTVQVQTEAGCRWDVGGVSLPLDKQQQTGSGSFTLRFSPRMAGGPINIDLRVKEITVPFTVRGVPASSLYRFWPGPFCNWVESRAPGRFESVLPAATPRSYPFSGFPCPMPDEVSAYSLNIAAFPKVPLAYMSLWPSVEPQPFVSTLNSFDGRNVSNAAIVPRSGDGAISAYASHATDLRIDVTGAFARDGWSFYPVTPCRVADTRAGSGFTGPFGQPPLQSSVDYRSISITQGNCGIPASARAFALNVTAVPRGAPGYIEIGGAQIHYTATEPVATAVLTGTSDGTLGIRATSVTDAVIDINGYFTAGGDPGAVQFQPVSPCRVADTRNGPAPTAIPGQGTRAFTIAGTCGIPADATAYSLNVTAVPVGPLAYLTAWPAGRAQPFVSTLNSFNGQVVANAAIIPAGPGGVINVYVSQPSHVVIDVNGYFAPR